MEPGGAKGRIVVPLGAGYSFDLSPDGRWLAYGAPSHGPHPWEVIVEAFPGSESRKQVSVGGGRNPMWSPDSRTVYYLGDREPDGPAASVFAVDIAASSALVPGKPRHVLRYPNYAGCTPLRCYDMSPDGDRFLFGEVVPHPSVTRMDLVLNWTATLPRGR